GSKDAIEVPGLGHLVDLGSEGDGAPDAEPVAFDAAQDPVADVVWCGLGPQRLGATGEGLGGHACDEVGVDGSLDRGAHEPVGGLGIRYRSEYEFAPGRSLPVHHPITICERLAAGG